MMKKIAHTSTEGVLSDIQIMSAGRANAEMKQRNALGTHENEEYLLDALFCLDFFCYKFIVLKIFLIIISSNTRHINNYLLLMGRYEFCLCSMNGFAREFS